MQHQHRRYDFRNHHFEGEEGKLIPLLQEAQREDGFLRRERLEDIHRRSGIPLADIYGVATFYAQFRLRPAGKHVVRVCHGTACHVSGAAELTQSVEAHLGIPTGETTPDREYSIETVSCLGCCSLAPVMMVDNTTYGNLSPAAAVKALKKRQKEKACI
ncbi:MAG TPA: NADH-quinone oxidoreductase subunit NuoE [Vicinamibacterales bacterium]|nr:NADH-quinone oxidoreductase subunit NuoE [Vicinamibacterales bacterium]